MSTAGGTPVVLREERRIDLARVHAGDLSFWGVGGEENPLARGRDGSRDNEENPNTRQKCPYLRKRFRENGLRPLGRLAGSGCAVTEAKNGAEALFLPSGSTEARIDLLVTGVKVLSISGYTDDAVAHLGVLDRGARFLRKLFAPASSAGGDACLSDRRPRSA